MPKRDSVRVRFLCAIHLNNLIVLVRQHQAVCGKIDQWCFRLHLLPYGAHSHSLRDHHTEFEGNFSRQISCFERWLVRCKSVLPGNRTFNSLWISLANSPLVRCGKQVFTAGMFGLLGRGMPGVFIASMDQKRGEFDACQPGYYFVNGSL